jgi:hypothetical protein
MNRKTTKNQADAEITGNEIQRRILLAEVRKSLEKLGNEEDQAIVVARDYLRDGMAEDEIRELLLIDGYRQEAIEGCMSRVASGKAEEAEEAEEDEVDEWGLEEFDSELKQGKASPKFASIQSAFEDARTAMVDHGMTVYLDIRRGHSVIASLSKSRKSVIAAYLDARDAMRKTQEKVSKLSSE